MISRDKMTARIEVDFAIHVGCCHFIFYDIFREENNVVWLIENVKTLSKYGQANLFGVILYTDAHPNIKKVLNDDDYWNAFDEISGKRWAIFSTRAEKGCLEEPNPESESVLGFMVSVWKEPSANKELMEVFEISSTKNLPIFIAFALDDYGNILKNTLPLNEDTQESAYQSIKTIISIITTSIEGVQENYLRDAEGVYSAVSLGIKHYKDWEKLRKGLQFWKWLKSHI